MRLELFDHLLDRCVLVVRALAVGNCGFLLRYGLMPGRMSENGGHHANQRRKLALERCCQLSPRYLPSHMQPPYDRYGYDCYDHNCYRNKGLAVRDATLLIPFSTLIRMVMLPEAHSDVFDGY